MVNQWSSCCWSSCWACLTRRLSSDYMSGIQCILLNWLLIIIWLTKFFIIKSLTNNWTKFAKAALASEHRRQVWHTKNMFMHVHCLVLTCYGSVKMYIVWCWPVMAAWRCILFGAGLLWQREDVHCLVLACYGSVKMYIVWCWPVMAAWRCTLFGAGLVMAAWRCTLFGAGLLWQLEDVHCLVLACYGSVKMYIVWCWPVMAAWRCTLFGAGLLWQREDVHCLVLAWLW